MRLSSDLTETKRKQQLPPLPPLIISEGRKKTSCPHKIESRAGLRRSQGGIEKSKKPLMAVIESAGAVRSAIRGRCAFSLFASFFMPKIPVKMTQLAPRCKRAVTFPRSEAGRKSTAKSKL